MGFNVNTGNTSAIVPIKTTPAIPPPLEPYESKYIVPELLGNTCTKRIYDFGSLGVTEITEYGHMIYIDNGADILAIGHLDTVVKEQWWKMDASGRKFYSPQLDDRLGVHILLNVLPQLGLKYDILLTDSEEIGKSTAQFFKPNKQYNWIFEVDRCGDDVALYQYINQKEFTDALKDVGLEVNRGSNTDITYVDYLGVAGCNFACAYEMPHSPTAYVWLDKLDTQIDKIVEFYWKNKDTYFPWKKEDVKTYSYNGRSFSYAEDEDWYTKKYSGYSGAQVYDTKTRQWKPLNESNLAITTKKNNVEAAKKNLKEKEKSDDVCCICGSEFCVGTSKCDACKFDFHSNLFVIMFGYCEGCLIDNFDVDESDIQVVNNGSFHSDAAVRRIYNMINYYNGKEIV